MYQLMYKLDCACLNTLWKCFSDPCATSHWFVGFVDFLPSKFCVIKTLFASPKIVEIWRNLVKKYWHGGHSSWRSWIVAKVFWAETILQLVNIPVVFVLCDILCGRLQRFCYFALRQIFQIYCLLARLSTVPYYYVVDLIQAQCLLIYFRF